MKWNFTKFVVDANGEVVARFEPTASFEDKSVCEKVTRLNGCLRTLEQSAISLKLKSNLRRENATTISYEKVLKCARI